MGYKSLLQLIVRTVVVAQAVEQRHCVLNSRSSEFDLAGCQAFFSFYLYISGASLNKSLVEVQYLLTFRINKKYRGLAVQLEAKQA